MIKIGDNVIIKRSDLYNCIGKINDIIDNPNQPILYGVYINDRIIYCKEDEVEIKPTKLRLLLFPDCDRNCPMCCNKQFDLTILPNCNDFSNYEEIILTGGEPLLHPNIIKDAIYKIRSQNTTAKIFLYTANYSSTLDDICSLLDGITVTLHNALDIDKFLKFEHESKNLNNKSLKLVIFKEVYSTPIRTNPITNNELKHTWFIKDNVEWIENCPLPKDEIFMKYIN